MKYEFKGTYYDIQELAKMLKIPCACVSRDLRSGAIEVIRVGMNVIVEEGEALRYVTAKQAGETFEAKKSNPEGMLSIKNMSLLIERSPTWLNSRLNEGSIPFITIDNGRKFVKKEDFDLLLEQGFGKKWKRQSWKKKNNPATEVK